MWTSPAGAGNDGLFTNSDAQPTVRVRFEITEDLLLARLTYERIDNTDGKGVRRTPDGQIVAAYRIESHFDIKRDYNPQTGEELNVVVENTTDRPWYERTHFRVDWSKNVVTDAYELDTLSQLGIYYGVTWEPVAYYVNDPENPDAPVFDKKRGYFDVTNKVWAAPGVIHDEMWGDFPSCWLYGSFPSENCNPSEITLRQSYLRVRTLITSRWSTTAPGWTCSATSRRTVSDTTVAMVWLTTVGIGSPRAGTCSRSPTPTRWSVQHGGNDAAGADPHRDDDWNGTEDECESVGAGSRCDAISGACTLPYRARHGAAHRVARQCGLPGRTVGGHRRRARSLEQRATRRHGSGPSRGVPEDWGGGLRDPDGLAGRLE